MNTSEDVIFVKSQFYIELVILPIYWAALPEAFFVLKTLDKYLLTLFYLSNGKQMICLGFNEHLLQKNVLCKKKSYFENQ